MSLIERVKQAKDIVDLYVKYKRDPPANMVKLANTPLDPDQQYHEMVNHDLWKKKQYTRI